MRLELKKVRVEEQYRKRYVECTVVLYSKEQEDIGVYLSWVTLYSCVITRFHQSPQINIGWYGTCKLICLKYRGDISQNKLVGSRL